GEPVWLEADGFEDAVRPRYLLFHPPTYAGGVTYPKRVLGARDRELATALYDSGLAYIDQQLSDLLSTLESEGLLENTIVVVTSDHGESLYEHGLVGHSSLYDQDLEVPLVIAAPVAGARGRRVKAQIRSVDIAPTLAELAGLAPLADIDGSSLVPMLRGESALPRNAWSYALSTTRGVSLRSAGRRKYIAQDTVFDPFRGGFEAYDLLQDPGELKNLATGAVAADRSRQGMIREVAAGETGLQVRLANAGPGELSGLLSGDAIDFMITSPDLSFSCCQSTAQGVRFHVPAGASFTLVLHDQPLSGTLKIGLQAAGRSWDGELPLDTLPRRWHVALEGGRWRAEDRESRRGGWTGIEIRHEPSAGRVRSNEDKVLKGLRSLGYIR
ncbi:MAG TPA: sulfatase-like hydrolase/transferase, partial [Thermoanaerobaculia bacterium]|nr:sulfatase-like hydrolase/transferase [Thermoanaerobaculia bacterium]